MQTNNKLREALVQVQKKIKYLIGNLTVPNSLVASRMEINGIINAALAAPVKNCEVGTVEEQYRRFMTMCNSKDARQCSTCMFRVGCYTSRDKCFARWAQMPYVEKEGETK